MSDGKENQKDSLFVETPTGTSTSTSTDDDEKKRKRKESSSSSSSAAFFLPRSNGNGNGNGIAMGVDLTTDGTDSTYITDSMDHSHKVNVTDPAHVDQQTDLPSSKKNGTVSLSSNNEQPSGGSSAEDEKKAKKKAKRKAQNAKYYQTRAENGKAQEYYKNRVESGETQEYYKNRKESGEAQVAYAKTNGKKVTKISAALRAQHEKATAENKDNHEATLGPSEVELIVDATLAKLGDLSREDFFLHVFAGSGNDQNARTVESFGGSSYRGRGIPSVVNSDNGSPASFKQVKERINAIPGGKIDISFVYDGVNFCNADAIEKGLHHKLIARGLHQEKRMFRHASMGTSRPASVPPGTPFPCYVALLFSNVSMERAGLRLGNKEDKDANDQRNVNKKAKKAVDVNVNVQLSIDKNFTPAASSSSSSSSKNNK